MEAKERNADADADDGLEGAAVRAGVAGRGALGEYVEAGHEVWRRQGVLRAVRGEANQLAERQAVQFAKLLEETKVDRALCEAAFEAGFIDRRVELSLSQGETADSIRREAERVGVPWRGLAVEELMEVLRETAGGKRAELLKLLQHTLRLRAKALGLIGVAQRRGAMLDGARDEAVAEVRALVDRLVRALREREAALVETAEHVADDRKRNLKAGLDKAVGEIARTQQLLDRGGAIKELDDLRLLSALHNAGAALDAQLAAVDESLREVDHGQRRDSEQGLGGGSDGDPAAAERKHQDGDEEAAATEPPAPVPAAAGAPAADEEFRAPRIPFNYDPFLLRRIALFGSVGTLDRLKLERNDQPSLVWDPARSDADVLGLSKDGGTVLHRGTRDKRASAFAKNGFAKGTVVMRIALRGLKAGQWVALGVASAAQLNMPTMIRDSVILEAGDQHDDAAALPGTVCNGATVSIVLDCETRMVEYYKQGVQIKLTVLEPPARLGDAQRSISVANMQHFYPYVTLFHPGQAASLLE